MKGGLGNLMKQAQKMQEDMQRAQEEVAKMEVEGKAGGGYGPFQGFTLETQRFPDSPNHGHFPSSVLRPGELYDHRMRFEFAVG